MSDSRVNFPTLRPPGLRLGGPRILSLKATLKGPVLLPGGDIWAEGWWDGLPGQMLGSVLNRQDSSDRRSLTSHQEPDGRPGDSVGIAGHALVPPAVTGDDATDLQGQVGQLGDSARRGR